MRNCRLPIDCRYGDMPETIFTLRHRCSVSIPAIWRVRWWARQYLRCSMAAYWNPQWRTHATRSAPILYNGCLRSLAPVVPKSHSPCWTSRGHLRSRWLFWSIAGPYCIFSSKPLERAQAKDPIEGRLDLLLSILIDWRSQAYQSHLLVFYYLQVRSWQSCRTFDWGSKSCWQGSQGYWRGKVKH